MIFFPIEIMNSIIKPLHELIQHYILSQQRLEPYKMSQKQVSDIFMWLDHRRRGYVDVSDFYSKFTQLSEGQLFYIFKFLDVSRKGAFTHQDLTTVLCNKSVGQRDQNDSIRSFTNLIRVVKATFHLIQQHKRNLGLTLEKVQEIFFKATLKRKDSIDLTDLIILFKQAQLQVNQKMVMYLKNKVFIKPNLSLKQFTTTFSKFIWQESSSKQLPLDQRNMVDVPVLNMQTKTIQKIQSTQKVCSQIDKILQKYKNSQSFQTYQPRKQLKQTKYQSSNGEQIWDNFNLRLQRQRKQNLQHINVNSGNEQKFKRNFNFLDRQQFSSPSPTNEVYSEINKRRQQLRKGSIQRQKIIDEVVNRKRMEGLNTSNKPGMLYKHNIKIQPSEKHQLQVSQTPIPRPFTPTAKYTQPKFNFDSNANPRLYQTLNQSKQNYSRPSSAIKTSTGFYQRSLHSSKPDLMQFYRKTETPKNYNYEKENILKRAQQQATKKIQQIQRRARLKVMEKRTTAGIYNRWFK